MKSRKYIKDFTEGSVMMPDEDYYFFVKFAAVKTDRNGKKYIDCKLSDGKEEVNGKVWKVDAEKELVIASGNIVKILNGRIGSYNNKMQIVIEDADSVKSEEIDTLCSDIIPESYADMEMLSGRWELLKKKLDEPCYGIIEAFETHEKVWEKFREIPAGRSMHHAYRHGLFEHSVHVAELCDILVARYKDIYPIKHSQLLFCAMIHDVGKVFEFETHPTSHLVNKYSDRGRLLGHIYMGTTFFEKIINQLSCGEDFKMEVLHMLLSHHGEYEFGSPKIPKTLEAMILSFADNFDANLDAVNKAIDEAGEDSWTKNVFSMGRRFFNTYSNNDKGVKNGKN
ncbi:MAG: HD domain-containing protein [bacterium]